MNGHAITMLGTGLIGDFYTDDAPRPARPRPVRVVYSRSPRARRRRSASAGTSLSRRPTWRPRSTTPTPTWSSSALPNFLHEEAVGLAAAAGKAVLCTKPLGPDRRGGATDARRRRVGAGVFGGYLEDLCYTPKTLKAIESVAGGRDRRRDLGPLTRDPSRAAFSAWFWDGRLTGGGAIIDLGCHCIEIIRNFVGKGNRPVEVMCHTDTLVHPIADEDNAVALIRFESGAIGQFEVSWTFRGGMDLRDEVAGTHGTIWLNHFLRTGLRDVHAPAAAAATSPRRPRPRPAGCSRSATRSPSSATWTCSATCSMRSTRAGRRRRRSTTAMS